MTTTDIELPAVDPTENCTLADGVEQMLREAATLVEQRLAERRAMRDQLNKQIKTLVSDQETITQALRPFSRAARTNGDT